VDIELFKLANRRLLELLIDNTYQCYSMSLAGNPAPKTKRAYEMMVDPHPGDLVMELSTIHWTNQDKNRIGKLLRIEQVPTWSRQEWEAEGETGPIPTEKQYVIEPLTAPGTESAWKNAVFIRVLTDRFGP